MGGRALQDRAESQPYFIAAATHAVEGPLIPVRGGVLIKADGKVIGSVGVSGDASDKDEGAALAGHRSRRPGGAPQTVVFLRKQEPRIDRCAGLLL